MKTEYNTAYKQLCLTSESPEDIFLLGKISSKMKSTVDSKGGSNTPAVLRIDIDIVVSYITDHIDCHWSHFGRVAS